MKRLCGHSLHDEAMFCTRMLDRSQTTGIIYRNGSCLDCPSARQVSRNTDCSTLSRIVLGQATRTTSIKCSGSEKSHRTLLRPDDNSMKFSSANLRKWVSACSCHSAVAKSTADNAADSIRSRSKTPSSGMGMRNKCRTKSPVSAVFFRGEVSSRPLGNSAILPDSCPAYHTSARVVANMSMSITWPRKEPISI